MATVRPYLLTDRNRFLADTTRHWEEFICKVSTEFLQWFRRRCDNGENQRWLPVAIFVNRAEPFLGGHNLRPQGEHLRQVSKKSNQWSRRCANKKTFMDKWMDHYWISVGRAKKGHKVKVVCLGGHFLIKESNFWAKIRGVNPVPNFEIICPAKWGANTPGNIYRLSKQLTWILSTSGTGMRNYCEYNCRSCNCQLIKWTFITKYSYIATSQSGTIRE